MTTECIDARGLRCPLPVLRMERRLGELPAGARLTVLATDPMARVDIPLYCAQHGHACAHETEGGVMRFEIVKSDPGASPSPPRGPVRAP